MQIRYTPRRNTPEIDISGLAGPWGRWSAGETREIKDGQSVAFMGADGKTRMTPLAEVLFSCGPDFVDASTGKNPNFTCADCGVETLDIAHLNRLTSAMVPYRIDSDESKPRLCVACYLGRYPEFIVAHRAAGTPEEILARAEQRASVAQSKPAFVPPSAPVAPKPAAQADAVQEN